MSRDGWRERIVGDRMQVDGTFAARVKESQFSLPQWDLIMTAVDLRIEGQGESARLVADASKVRHVLPELDRFGGGPPGSHGQQRERKGSGGGLGGLFGSITSAFGLGSGSDEKTLEEARALAEEYAATLQTHLERAGRWEGVVEEARDQSPE